MDSKNERIAWFDLETTGLEFETDRVISLSIIITDQLGKQYAAWSSKFNPEGVKIRPEVFDKHGITDAELLNCPTFAERAKEIAAFMEGCDIGGHNVIKFDIPFLIHEFDRCGVYFSVEKRRIIDTLSLYRSVNRSTLFSIYKEYYGVDPKYAAHDSYGDTCVTVDVYKALLATHKMTKEEIDDVCMNKRRIDMSGLFVFNDDMEIIIGKGKWKGTKVEDMDIKYLKWVYEDSDYSLETKSLALRCYKYLQEKRMKELKNGES